MVGAAFLVRRDVRFSMFSVLSYETFRLLKDRDYYTMLSNIVSNGTGSIPSATAAFRICSALIVVG